MPHYTEHPGPPASAVLELVNANAKASLIARGGLFLLK